MLLPDTILNVNNFFFSNFSVMAEQPGSPNHRLKSYKNKGMDSSEMRRRREEEGIQLRKEKRAQQVRKVMLNFIS